MSFIRNRLQEIDYQEYLREQEFLMDKEAVQIFGFPTFARWGSKLWHAGNNALGKMFKPSLVTQGDVAKRGLMGRLNASNARGADGSLVYNFGTGSSSPMANKRTSMFGSWWDTLQGGTPTRRDQLMQSAMSNRLKAINDARQKAGKSAYDNFDAMLADRSVLGRRGIQSQIEKEIAPKLKMSKWEFLKNHPGEALPWYGKQIGYKGLTYGVPAYDIYDSARDPNRGIAEGLGSAAGGTLGFVIPGKARGIGGMAAQVGGAMLGSMAGGGLAKTVTGGGLKHTAAGAMNGNFRVPPPQAMPAPQPMNYQQAYPAFQQPPQYYGQ